MKTRPNSSSEGSELAAGTYRAGSLPQPLQPYSNRNMHLSPILVTQACAKLHPRVLLCFVLTSCQPYRNQISFLSLGLLASHFVKLKYQSWEEDTPKKERMLAFLMYSDKKEVGFRQNLCYIINK